MVGSIAAKDDLNEDFPRFIDINVSIVMFEFNNLVLLHVIESSIFVILGIAKILYT